MKSLTISMMLFLAAAVFLLAFTIKKEPAAGYTEITKWQYGKPAAVSLTYDDGYMKQFTEALPIMNRLKLPATFFIITGQITGSQYHGKFIGRPVETIIAETAVTPTNKENFFERASAVGYLGYKGTMPFHTESGNLYVSNKVQQAYHLIDSVYKKVREGGFEKQAPATASASTANRLTWDNVRAYMKDGHEFASHTVSHPMTPVLDVPNLLYELEKSKEEIGRELGKPSTFSAECSYGIEDERVMSYAYKVYPALRNRMPEEWMTELNRSSRKLPGSFNTEYVQWQRGATTKTLMPLMKSWVDTVLTHDNNWLVLVYHGVDGNGYEALKHEDLDEYFQYVKAREDKLWVATFADVAKYMRERMAAKVLFSQKGNTISVVVTHPLDKSMYNLPVTLKTYVASTWAGAEVKQGAKSQRVKTAKDAKGTYVMYQAIPNSSSIQLSKI